MWSGMYLLMQAQTSTTQTATCLAHEKDNLGTRIHGIHIISKFDRHLSIDADTSVKFQTDLSVVTPYPAVRRPSA